MNLQSRRVLVTGADGFIGSHLAERLVQECGRVRALVQYNSFNDWGWLEEVPCRDGEPVSVGSNGHQRRQDGQRLRAAWRQDGGVYRHLSHGQD